MIITRIFISAIFLFLAGLFPLLELIFNPTQAKGEGSKAENRIELRAGEEQEFEIATDVPMVFCWIPTGEAQLGSPKTEQDHITKMYYDGDRPELLDAESEEKRGKFKSKGFWLGKYPVTQGEWKAVMKDNPSWFQLKGDGNEKLQKDKIKETSRFPVEQVSWDDCQLFLKNLNNREGVQKAFIKRGKFCLPHEDEWEYACRSGKGNKRAFFWGDELNGSQANCSNKYPHGTETKGPYLDRPCNVDETNGGKYEKHPWGLFHMHGNIFEWCENKYDQTKDDIVLRGGCWNSIGWVCRSANRFKSAPNIRSYSYGFRVCFRPDS